MKSINPVKSHALNEQALKIAEKTGDKSVVTSVHGIMNANFSFHKGAINNAYSRQKNVSQNTSPKYLPYENKEIRKIKIEMPALGLEQAVVYPKSKRTPDAIQLRKKKLKKGLSPQKSYPLSSYLKSFQSRRDTNPEQKNNQDNNVKYIREKTFSNPKEKRDENQQNDRKDNKFFNGRSLATEKTFIYTDGKLTAKRPEDDIPKKLSISIEEYNDDYAWCQMEDSVGEMSVECVQSPNERASVQKEMSEQNFIFDEASIIEERESKISIKSSDTYEDIVKERLFCVEGNFTETATSADGLLDPSSEVRALINKKKPLLLNKIKADSVMPPNNNQLQTCNQPIVQKKSSLGSRIPKFTRNINNPLLNTIVNTANEIQKANKVGKNAYLTRKENKTRESKASLRSTHNLKKFKSVSKTNQKLLSVSKTSNKLGSDSKTSQKLDSMSKTSHKLPVGTKSVSRYSKTKMDYIKENFNQAPFVYNKDTATCSKQIKEFKGLLQSTIPIKKTIQPKKIAKNF